MPGDEIFYLSVSELAKRIESKKLSPVDLTQAYLDRSQKLGLDLTPTPLDTRDCSRTSQGSGKRDPARPLPWPAARDSLRRKRPAGSEGTSDHVGREALREPGIRLQRDSDRTSESRGSGDDR